MNGRDWMTVLATGGSLYLFVLLTIWAYCRAAAKRRPKPPGWSPFADNGTIDIDRLHREGWQDVGVITEGDNHG